MIRFIAWVFLPAALALPVLAQEVGVPPTTVVVPWGEWIVGIAETLQPVVTLALTGIVSYLVSAYVPSWVQAFVGDAAQRRVSAVLQKAVSSAIARTKHAVSGKEASIPVASEILARAMQYAVDQAPDLMKAAADDKVENLSNMVLARMEEAGVVPENYDMKTVSAEIAPAKRKKEEGKFDFAGAIRTGMGGGG